MAADGILWLRCCWRMSSYVCAVVADRSQYLERSSVQDLTKCWLIATPRQVVTLLISWFLLVVILLLLVPMLLLLLHCGVGMDTSTIFLLISLLILIWDCWRHMSPYRWYILLICVIIREKSSRFSWTHVEAWSLISWIHIYISKSFLYWCHDGKHIVPVIVLVWDSLSSPWGAALVQESVGDGSVGATDMSRSRCLVSERIKGLCSFWDPCGSGRGCDVGVPLLRV